MHFRLEHVAFCGAPARTALSAARTVDRGARTDDDTPERDVALARHVLALAGLPSSSYRARTLARRTPACLRAIGAAGASCVDDALRQSSDMRERALQALLIGVTAFFRDAEVFETLKRQVLPSLSPSTRGVRAWSAGCAAGAELYSVAMLLADAGRLQGSVLVGTDCRDDAIRQARAGVYESAALDGVHADGLARYFQPDPGGAIWRVHERIRRHTAFSPRDVLQGPERGPWDLVLWRNVGIYLEPEAAAVATAAIVKEIVPGGVLVVGRAERPRAELPLRRIARCVYRKVANGR
jgi:chemotaxis protein methyltransferase CheR